MPSNMSFSLAGQKPIQDVVKDSMIVQLKNTE